MNATLKSLVLALLALGFVNVSGIAQAQGRAELRLYPDRPEPEFRETPRLGFVGHFDRGRGMHVESVAWGTPASRVGLEPGDVIVAVNGHRLHSESDYRRLLRTSGGYVRLAILDWRSGAVVSRTAWLEGGNFYRTSSRSL